MFELVVCKSVSGGLEESRGEVGSWDCVDSLLTHLEWLAMMSDSVEVFGLKGIVRDELVRQSILASSKYPAKGIRRISLFKVDSGGKRRLLHCCHRSDMNRCVIMQRTMTKVLTYL